MKVIVLTILSAILLLSNAQSCKKCNENCPTGDCLNSDISQQTNCYEVSNQAAKHNLCQWWANGLDSQTDLALLGGKVVAYKIQWSGGSWSGWYVPGVNDLDCKYNTQTSCNGKAVCPGSLRRAWGYFYDHVHTYIICKS